MEIVLSNKNDFLTIEETSQILGVCIPTVRKYIDNKQLGAFKMHRIVRVPKTELEKFINKQMSIEYERSM